MTGGPSAGGWAWYCLGQNGGNNSSGCTAAYLAPSTPPPACVPNGVYTVNAKPFFDGGDENVCYPTNEFDSCGNFVTSWVLCTGATGSYTGSYGQFP
jgi:hypothetical protein